MILPITVEDITKRKGKPSPVIALDEVARRCRIECDLVTLESCLAGAVSVLESQYSVSISRREFLATYKFAIASQYLVLTMRPNAEIVSVEIDDGITPGYDLMRNDRSQSLVKINTLWSIAKVRYRAGSWRLPDDLKTALLLLTSHIYERYSATSDNDIKTIPMGVQYIMEPYRPPKAY